MSSNRSVSLKCAFPLVHNLLEHKSARSKYRNKRPDFQWRLRPRRICVRGWFVGASWLVGFSSVGAGGCDAECTKVRPEEDRLNWLLLVHKGCLAEDWGAEHGEVLVFVRVESGMWLQRLADWGAALAWNRLAYGRAR